MLSTRAAAFSVDALLNEDTAGAQVEQIQSGSKPATVFGSLPSKPATVLGSPASKPATVFGSPSNPATVFGSPAQPSPADASHSKNGEADGGSSPLGQPTRADRIKTPYDMFTKNDDDDGWLSIKGKECKIFPFKVGPGGLGLPNATPMSNSEPEIHICNLDRNAATTLGRSRVKLNNTEMQVSKTSDEFPGYATQRNERNFGRFLPFDSWKNSSSFIEQKVRSSSVDETLSSRKMECGHGTRSSLSHPSVLDSTMMSSFEVNSVFDTPMSNTTLFKAFQRRSASPKKFGLTDVGVASKLEIGEIRTVLDPSYVSETGFRNKNPEVGTDFTESGHEFIGSERPNFNARKQFLNVGNLNFRTDIIKQPTAGNFAEYEGKETFMGEKGNLHSYPHVSSALFDTRRLEDRRPSTDNASVIYHRANSEAQFTKMRTEASPIPVLSTQKGASFRSQENRYEDDQRRLDRGETAFRNWLASEPMETSSLSPHTRLLQSVLQGEIGQESSRDSGSTLRPPGCDELRRLLNRNEHIPNMNSFRSDEMEDTELIRLRGGVTVELLQKDLWQKFHQHGTEMIITKIGRRMFPVLRVRISGLDPSKLYLLYVDMHPVDHKRYRYVYQSSCWLVAGAADTQDQREGSGGTSPGTGTSSTVPCPGAGDTGSGIYLHPDSPASGAHWSAPHTIAFDKLKLTNNRRRPAGGQICLHSMQKYQPRIWIQEVTPDGRQPYFASPLNSASRNTFPVAPLEYVDADGVVKMDVDDVDKERMKLHYRRRPTNTELRPALGEDWLAKIDRRLADAAVFPVTSFITVTAYQNQQVTRLKISANPFAKGFRETIKQREDCDSHRPHERHSGAPHEHPIRSFYSHNLRSPFPAYFPHQTHLPPGQMINHLTNYPPFLLPSLPFFVHQWNVTNHRNAGTGSPLSSSDDSRINVDNAINHREGIGRFEGSTLPWEHSLSRQDEAKKLQQATASTLLRTMSSSYEDNHSSGILEATLKQPASFMQPASGLETRIDAPSMHQDSCHRIESPKNHNERCRDDRIADECIARNSSYEEKIGITTVPFTSSQVETDVTSKPVTSSDLDGCSARSTFKSEINAGLEKWYPDGLWCKPTKPDTFRLYGMPTKQTHDLGSVLSSSPSEVSRRISSSLSQLAKEEPEQNYVCSHEDQTSSKNGNLTRKFLLRELSHSNAIVQLSTASIAPSCSEPDDCSVLDLTKKK